MDKTGTTKFWIPTPHLLPQPPSKSSFLPSSGAVLNNNNNKAIHSEAVQDIEYFEPGMGIYNDNNMEAFNMMATLQENQSPAADIDSLSTEASAGNSTDNLSCLTDNEETQPDGINEETYSEEEVNSDDCIYAYRGADFEESESRSNPVDDETDFLEMDFDDPDPASEVENTNDSQSLSFDRNTNAREITQYRHLFTSTDRNGEESTSSENTKFNFKEIKNDSPQANNAEWIFDNIEKNEANTVSIDELKGARPKQVITKNIKPAHSRAQNTGKSIVDGSSPHTQKETELDLRRKLEDSCLDCLEKDFLLQTVGRKVETIKCTKCCGVRDGDFSNKFTGSLRLTDIRETDIENKFPRYESPLSRGLSNHAAKKLLNDDPKRTVTISTAGITEDVLINALDTLDISYCRKTLKDHFEAEKCKDFKDVTDYIDYMSKKTCDYKKTIRLLQRVSNDSLQIDFIANHHSAESEETVQIDIYEILQLWTPQADLRRLKHFGGKNFTRKNVLGKIINAIRQSHQNFVKPASEFISVPQYYKGGFIRLSKK